ncbi:MAG: ABC transporter permease [Acidimicrobiales bacterium]
MTRFVAGRLGRLVFVLLLVTFATTWFLDLTPSSPAIAIAGPDAQPEILEAINEQYGFNDPLVTRYGRWINDVTHGDLGRSYLTRQPVTESLVARLPVTIELTLLATVLALVLSVPAAMITAYRSGSRIDRGTDVFTSIVLCMPSFLTALLLIYVFAIKLHWFPIQGWVPISRSLTDNLRGAFLPALTVAMTEIVAFQRVLRADLIQTLQQDYIAMARSKGISTSRIMVRHALRPSSLSLITLGGISVARLLAGTIVVEIVFTLPGVGRLLVNAVLNKDLIMVQGLVLFIAGVYLVVNLLVDILYAAVDPRVRVR